MHYFKSLLSLNLYYTCVIFTKKTHIMYIYLMFKFCKYESDIKLNQNIIAINIFID